LQQSLKKINLRQLLSCHVFSFAKVRSVIEWKQGKHKQQHKKIVGD